MQISRSVSEFSVQVHVQCLEGWLLTLYQDIQSICAKLLFSRLFGNVSVFKGALNAPDI